MMALYTLIILQVIDVVTTLLCLRTGRAQEANPMLAKLFGVLGVTPTLLLIKGIFIAYLLWVAAQIPVIVLWAVSAGYVWVVFNNLKVILK